MKSEGEHGQVRGKHDWVTGKPKEQPVQEGDYPGQGAVRNGFRGFSIGFGRFLGGRGG